jgi:chemotaxis methyl-accepting protein methylase
MEKNWIQVKRDAEDVFSELFGTSKPFVSCYQVISIFFAEFFWHRQHFNHLAELVLWNLNSNV